MAQLEKEDRIGDFNQPLSNVPTFNEPSGKLSKLDYNSKLKEDPLQDIRRKQTEIIKEILSNPIKKRKIKIKKLLEESLKEDKKKKKKKKKKKELKKEKIRQINESDDDRKKIKKENLIDKLNDKRNKRDKSEDRLISGKRIKKEELINLKLKSMRRRKFKIGCQYVDFINEFGYKKNIQLVITKIFNYLDDKELMASFCVSKKWNSILKQNDNVSKRRLNYIKKQNELKDRIGLENYPGVIKGEIKRSSRRKILGEMTNQGVLNT